MAYYHNNKDGTRERIASNQTFQDTPTETLVTREEFENVEDRVDILENDVEELKSKADYVYGFQIDGNESDPSAAVTYLADAVGMTPAHMDYTHGVFNYGSWEDAFFMPRPCMLKSDGTVDYYLDPNDYSKKEDGTASDIANTSYDGNAMMEWGKNGRKIWMKISPFDNGKSAKIWISNYKVDNDFHDWPFHNCKGESADHFYTAIYPESIVDNVMRSISGLTSIDEITPNEFIISATANNATEDELWNIGTYSDMLLINMLLVLMGKSLDSQIVFGIGLCSGGGSEFINKYRTGVHNQKGLFYGTDNGTLTSNAENTIKIFGMENYYGFRNAVRNGCIYDKGTHKIKVKMTYGGEDGTNITGYNTTGADYLFANSDAISLEANGYIGEYCYSEYGMAIQTVNGSDSTYYCDMVAKPSDTATMLSSGGSCSWGNNYSAVGIFFVSFSTPGNSWWTSGAALSCKPLVE